MTDEAAAPTSICACSHCTEAVRLTRQIRKQLDLVEYVCHQWSAIPGVERLLKRGQTERKFIEGLVAEPISGASEDCGLRLEKLRSSNANQLCAVARELERLQLRQATEVDNDIGGCCAILEKFPCLSDEPLGAATKVEVDLVCRGGALWVKCVARNPRGLRQASRGEAAHGSGGARCLLAQARQLMRAADSAGPAPGAIRLRVHCAGGVTADLRGRLLAAGVDVSGDVLVAPDGEEEEKVEDDDSANGLECDAVTTSPALPCQPSALVPANLDVTCFVALASNLCRPPGRQKVFKERALALTAELERQQPCLAELKLFLAGRRLVVCQTAVAEFRHIVETVAGPTERRRAARWLSRAEEVPDQCPDCLRNRLRQSRSVQPRHLAVFGTGASLCAVTVTSNAKFVRAAGKQGVHFRVQLHGCRALTESREAGADVHAMSEGANAAADKVREAKEISCRSTSPQTLTCEVNCLQAEVRVVNKGQFMPLSEITQ